MTKKKLSLRTTLRFNVKEAFSFEETFYSPVRFPSKLELYKEDCYYFAMNLGYIIVGLKYYMCGKQLCLDIYSQHKCGRKTLAKIEEEIRCGLSGDNDYREFYNRYVNDKLLKNVIKRHQGKHNFSIYSLYENLIVSVFLQNATVQRTISMCQNMLEKYGTLLCFDNIEVYAMWRPEELHASEEELRLSKIGYRAKNILYITKHFVENNISEAALRKMPRDKLEKELLKIYGVGKQTVFYIIGGTENIKHIPVWERKILSKYIFNEELCEERVLVDWFREKYGKWCGLALSLIFEDIFHQHKEKPFLWLKEIMREK